MNQFDKTTLKQLRAELETTLKFLSEKHDIALSVGNIRFDKNKATIKLEALIKSASGEVFDQRAADFTMYAKLVGLQPTDLGRSFKTFDGNEYTIIGLDLKKRKYPVIVSRGSKRFKFTEAQVKAHLAV